MSTKTEDKHNSTANPVFGHAVVIGSSIAGLTVARVLTDHFARVTIVDRDHLPEMPEYRRGLPQTHHAHTLPLRGHQILEQQFPGLTEELIANGAVPINGGSEMAFFIAGKWIRGDGRNCFMSDAGPCQGQHALLQKIPTVLHPFFSSS